MVRYDDSTSRKGQQYIEDRRDGRRSGRMRRGGGSLGGGGLGGGGGFGGKSMGIGGLLIVLLASLFGFDLVGGGGSGTSGFDIGTTGFDAGADVGPVGGGGAISAAPDETKDYMAALMADIQDTWDEYFEQAGLNYEYTTMVIFDDTVSTGCGQATSAVGPFYCPAPGDNKVYIDFIFYDQLSRQFGAPGDFAQAYVIAHEIGHHLQSVLGISDAVRQAQLRDPGKKNEFSIRQELQADCFAGVWAFSASNRTNADGTPIIEPGDIEEGLRAAQAVGDDHIQSQAGMRINPETWTHGSAEQRKDWFMRGYQSGDPESCDTFS